ncbi:MAG TPA: hypothetical protein VIT20_04235 [Propionibacteriaceae bacterium]
MQQHHRDERGEGREGDHEDPDKVPCVAGPLDRLRLNAGQLRQVAGQAGEIGVGKSAHRGTHSYGNIVGTLARLFS